MARETSENSTYLYRTPVQYRCKWILYKLALFGRPKRLGYDENDRGCRSDSLHGFFGKITRIGFMPPASSTDIVGVSPMGEKGTLRHYGAAVRCLDRIHLMAYAAKLG